MPEPAPGHAGAQGGQLHEVAAVQRQLLHLLLLNHAAQHRRLAFEQWRRAFDQDGLADGADLQIEIDLRALIDLQFHSGALDLAKARHLGGEPVGAGGSDVKM